MLKFKEYCKKNITKKESVLVILSFVFITSFAIQLIMIMMHINFLQANGALMVNPKVFTPENKAYSVFLGGSIKITAIYRDGTKKNIPVRDKNYFNHGYTKVKSNIYSADFPIYENKSTSTNFGTSTFTYSKRYLAALQLFCTNTNINSVIIDRYLIKADGSYKTKTSSTTIACAHVLAREPICRNE